MTAPATRRSLRTPALALLTLLWPAAGAAQPTSTGARAAEPLPDGRYAVSAEILDDYLVCSGEVVRWQAAAASLSAEADDLRDALGALHLSADAAEARRRADAAALAVCAASRADQAHELAALDRARSRWRTAAVASGTVAVALGALLLLSR